jgi:hypothetical protein
MSEMNGDEANGGNGGSGNLKEMSAENLTAHVIKTSQNIDNPRHKYLLLKLIQATHDYVRDVDLKTDEWETAWAYLTEVVKILLQQGNS